ncbi:MAG: DUF222 domain-containing protein [Acidimicrobiales bacterium]
MIDEMRTSDQRLADAFVELVTGNAGSAGRSAGPPHPRHQLNVIFDLNGMTDESGRPLASLVVDGAPLPKAVLEQIRCTAGATMLFDGPGRPIWVERDERNATIAQWRALIARDRGCVGCGADPNRCEAHHILEWDNWGPKHRQPRPRLHQMPPRHPPPRSHPAKNQRPMAHPPTRRTRTPRPVLRSSGERRSQSGHL